MSRIAKSGYRNARSRAHRISGALTCAVSLALFNAAPSSAAPPDSGAAEALFREGRRLAESGKTADACAKFAQSHAVEPSSGALFNLATCNAELGRTATAWLQFLAAARLARAQQRPERAEEAQRRAAALEPLLSYVTVQVESPVPGLVVTRDGEQIEQAALGIPLPVDSGGHDFSVSAPGYESWSTTLSVGGPRESHILRAPALVPQPPPPPRAAPQTAGVDGRRERSSRPVTAAPPAERRLSPGFWVSGAASVGLAAVGTTTTLMSLSNYDRAHSLCPSHNDCNTTAMRAADSAELQADMAMAAFGTAAIAAAVSLWLYFSAPEQRVHHSVPDSRSYASVPR